MTNLTEIFLHGGPGLPEYLSRFFPSAPNRIFYAQKNPASSISELVEPLRQTLEPIENFALITHSFGGVIALEYLKRPLARKPQALILMGVPIYHGCEQDFAEECAKRNLTKPTPEDVFLSPKEKTNSECQANLQAIFEGFNPQTLGSIGKYLSTFDFRILLNQTEIPTLVISGADDVRVPARAQKNYGGDNPKIQYVSIPEAGHFTFMEKQNAILIQDKIHTFLTNLNPS